ncbi:ATP-binding protein [Actinomadura craniellae]|uniref:ATP-binding protein n=1 Tax=Actinomadura craniellae TaxID=2231787 RepID=UPI001314F4BE|nr:ATP-binding protein [Actinomadura craniellae]
MTFSVLPSINDPQCLRAFKLTVGTRAPEAARGKVTEALGKWGLSTLTEDVALCVSEFVTNSLVNDATEIHLVIERHTTETIEIAVWDDAPGMPQRRTPEKTAEDGRGLNIVEALAVSWWTQASGTGGKTVRARFVSDGER